MNYKKVVLSNPNPETEISIQDALPTGEKLYIGFKQPQNLCGFIATDGVNGLVVFNAQRLYHSDVLSPSDAEGNPIETYSSIKEAILACGSDWNFYQVEGMMGFAQLYKEKGTY